MQRAKQGSVNIREVATRAAVSTATVSRYLNGKNVRPAARQRIMTAIGDLSYSPNRLARGLKTKKSKVLGVVIPDITNPFFPAVVQGIEDTARAAGFSVMLFNTAEDEDRLWECLEAVHAQSCDGALVMLAPPGPRHAQRRQQLQKLTFPIVYVDRAPDFDADMVVCDNVQCSREAVRHLLRLGHVRIAALAPNHDVSVHRERLEGYRRALTDAGVPIVPAYEVRVTPTVSDGYSGASSLLSLPEMPSAIFVTSNRLTIGAMAAIESRGLRCPQDISILGWDNHDWQDVFHPRLTTMAQPAYLMGTRAAELLIQRTTEDRPQPARQILLQSSLVVRESCGMYLPRHGAGSADLDDPVAAPHPAGGRLR